MEQLNLKVSLNKNGSIKCVWSPIPKAHHYEVRVHQLGKSYLINKEENWKKTSYTSKANLEANQQYDVIVVAYSKTTSLTSDGKRILIKWNFYDNAPLNPPKKIWAQADTSSVAIRFQEVLHATNYDILFDGKRYNVDTTSKQFTGLAPKSSHTYAVRARSRNVISAYSEKKTITTLPQSPDVPWGIDKRATDHSATITWRPANAATSYDIEFNGATYNEIGTTRTFNGLEAGKLYPCRSCAKNPDVTSAYTAIYQVTTAPVAPALTSATSTVNTVTVNWSPVNGASGYIIKFNNTNFQVKAATNSYTFTALPPNTAFIYQVCSIGGDGVGSFSAEKGINTLALVPPAPENAQRNSTENSATISWGAMSGATSYDVLFQGKVYNVAGTSKTFTGLAPNTTYSYQIRCRIGDRVGSYGTVMTVMTTPGAPVGVEARYAGDSVTLSWPPVNGAVSYDIMFNGTVYNVTGTSKIFTGLTANTDYTYQVRVNNTDGSSSYCGAKTFKTVPIPPEMPDAKAESHAITLNWKAVDGATSYDIRFNETEYRVTETTKTFTELQSDTAYSFQVRANNAGGSSAYCLERTARTLPEAPTVPTGIIAKAEALSVIVSWEKVPAADSYDLLFQGEIYPVTATSKEITGLSSDTEYSYQVRAKNKGGDSAYSDVKKIRTLLNTPDNVNAKATRNSIIVGFDPVTGATNYEIEFDGKKYPAARERSVSNRKSVEKTRATISLKESNPGAARIYKTFSGLKPNSKHTYRVRAIHADCKSRYSEIKTIKTQISKQKGTTNGRKRKKYPDGKRTYLGIDPVNAITGAFLWSYTWLEYFGKDELQFTTMYDSKRDDPAHGFAKKWTHSFQYILDMDEEYAFFSTPYGEAVSFLKNAENGRFEPVDGNVSFDAMEKKEDGTYTVKDLDSTEYVFDTNLCLAKIIENGCITYSFRADDAGHITQVQGKYGSILNFAYKEDHIESATDVAGNKVSFTYQEDCLISVQNPDGKEMMFTYDEEDNLLTISDFSGKVYLTNTYDTKGRVTEQHTASRGVSLASYDEENHITTFTDELGNATKYTYNEDGNMLCVELKGKVTHNRYNERGQMIEQEDPLGNVTKMAYDACGRMNHVTYPDGTIDQVIYNDYNQPLSVISRDGTKNQYKYDAHNNLIEVQDERGNCSFYKYDEKDNLISFTDKKRNVWTYSYDTNNFLKQAVDPVGNKYQYEHDAIGRLLTYVSPEGRNISYQYSAAGNLLRMEDGDGAILYDYNENGNCTGMADRLGNKQRYAYNEMGQMTLATDFMGNEHIFSYDERGNLVRVTDPLGYHESYTYDVFGNNTSVTDGNGNTTNYTFNAVNQITEVTDAQGGIVKYVYDTMGQVKAVLDPLEHQTAYTYDSAGRITSVADALGNTVTYTYDAAGNLLTKADEEGALTKYAYDEENKLLSVETDAGIVRFTYDNLGRISSVLDTEGKCEAATYDADGNLMSLSDKEERCTTYVYDLAGHLSEETAPNGGKTTYVYDKNGNCVKITNAEGHVYSYKYNANNQMCAVTNPLGGESVYEYDAKGQLIAVTDPRGGKCSFVYDGNGNISRETNPLGGIKTYAYDSLNRITECVDEEGHRRIFAYDAAGNMTSYTDANERKWTYDYNAVNRLVEVSVPDGGCLKMEYTKTGKIAAVTDQEGARTSYQYDSLGRLLQMSDAMEHSISYTYDSLGRVSSQSDANGNTTEYEYSPVGNLLSVKDADGNITTYTYNALGQILTATDVLGNVSSYEYNLLGQTTAITDPMKAKTSFTYTAEGQIATVTDGNGNITRYGYDACGNLVQTVDALGTIVEYEYDAMNNQIKECVAEDQKQTCATIYQYDKRGCIVKEITPMLTEKAFTYDGNGNIVSVLDEEKNQTEIRYDMNDLPVLIRYNDGKEAVLRYNKRGELVELKDWNGVVTMERNCLGMITKVTDHQGLTSKIYL